MDALWIAIIAVLAILLLAALFTAIQASQIERRHPRHGELIDVGGFRLNSVHIPPVAQTDLPAIVFIHGASGNLQDQHAAFAARLEGRAEMLFVDRPGHGYSERGGDASNLPSGQARAIAGLMQARGIPRAIICGHSFGGAIATTFALNHPDMTSGLLLLSPATHPWPGGVDWYYNLAARPLLGRLFTRLASLPAGLMLIDKATKAVFHPNTRPDTYLRDGAPALVLRPASFRHNALDVVNLNPYVERIAPRYAEIMAPTIVITGDEDEIVAAHIHAAGIVATVPNAELVTIRGLGHKPDYVTTDVVIAAIETLGGNPGRLDGASRTAEARIAAESRDTSAAPDMDFSIEQSERQS